MSQLPRTPLWLQAGIPPSPGAKTESALFFAARRYDRLVDEVVSHAAAGRHGLKQAGVPPVGQNIHSGIKTDRQTGRQYRLAGSETKHIGQ